MTSVTVFTADSHLRETTWKSHPELRGDAYDAFAQIIDFAIEKSVNEVLLGGDVLDVNTPDPLTMQQLVTEMQRLQDAGIPCYFIVGQHERHRLAQWLNLHSWPTHIDGRIVRLRDLVLHGISYQPRTQLQSAIARIHEDANAVLVHQVWKETHGDLMQPEGCIADLPDRVEWVLTGDYHQHFVKQLAGHTVLSPGSICMQAINEVPEKQFFTLTQQNGITVASHKLKTRPFISISVGTTAELDAFIDRSQELFDAAMQDTAYDKPILRFIYAADIPDAFARAQAAVSSRCHLFPELVRCEQVVEVRNIVRGATGERGLLENLGQLISENDLSYDYAHALLTAAYQDDLSEMLSQLEERFLAHFRSRQRRSRR